MGPVADYRFTDQAVGGGKARIATYKGAYVSVTTFCNTDVCSYCYARDQIEKTHLRHMPLDLFGQVLDMLDEISDFPEVYLIGGEPTTVPNFGSYLAEIEKRNWHATLYTNGSANEKRLELIKDSAAVNRVVLHYEEYLFETFPWLRKRWEANLRALAGGPEISITGIIDGPEFPFRGFIDLAAEYQAAATWIFSTPTSGGTPYLDLMEMRALREQVQDMLLYALARGVKCSPGLAVPLCVFNPEFVRDHDKDFKLVRKCKPFAYFQVDGRISFCTSMPLYTARRPENADELAATIEYNREQDRLLREKPSFPQCETCDLHLKQVCQGGCLTYKVYQDPENRNTVRVPLPLASPGIKNLLTPPLGPRKTPGT
jgi:radical SAM protein with 4Fe4S-binding SPASM domain